MTKTIDTYECPVCGRRIPSGGRAGFLADHRFTGSAATVWLRPGEPCPGGGVMVDDLYTFGDDVPEGTRDPGLTDEQWLKQYFKDEYDPFRCRCAAYALRHPMGRNWNAGVTPPTMIAIP